MQGLQKEIFRHPEHFRTRQNQGRLPEVQGEKGQTGHLALHDQDQPEKLIAALEFQGRSGVTTSSGDGPSSMPFQGPHLRLVMGGGLVYRIQAYQGCLDFES
jgi:hypothetical protein